MRNAHIPIQSTNGHNLCANLAKERQDYIPTLLNSTLCIWCHTVASDMSKLPQFLRYPVPPAYVSASPSSALQGSVASCKLHHYISSSLRQCHCTAEQCTAMTCCKLHHNIPSSLRQCEPQHYTASIARKCCKLHHYIPSSLCQCEPQQKVHQQYSSTQYCSTRSLGALRAPTSSWRPSGPLDFVLCALRALRPCDPRKVDQHRHLVHLYF